MGSVGRLIGSGLSVSPWAFSFPCGGARFESVHLIVHSIGNALLSHLMEQAGTRLSTRQKAGIDQLILAAPDIDRAVFEQVSQHFKRHSKAVTLYASSTDIALHVSETIRAAYPRAGDVPEDGPITVEGVDTMDVSLVESGLFGLKHSSYGDNDRVINDVIARIKGFHLPPDKRLTDVELLTASNGSGYYKFKNVKR
ncbi:MAG: alpha/beta hydrolase [Roseobacter sp.]